MFPALSVALTLAPLEIKSLTISILPCLLVSIKAELPASSLSLAFSPEDKALATAFILPC